MSSETYNKLHIQYHHIGVARFPNVAFLQVKAAIVCPPSPPDVFSLAAFLHPSPSPKSPSPREEASCAVLQCCSTNYASSTASKRSRRCFAKACSNVPCPPALSGACSGSLSFKYFDEGHSAVLHATALSLPGASFARANDSTPPRLHIEIPRQMGEMGVLYTCKSCETANKVDPVSLNVTGCLFTQKEYGVAVLDHARKAHSCRYYDNRTIRTVCSLVSKRELVRKHYPWWCQDLWQHM